MLSINAGMALSLVFFTFVFQYSKQCDVLFCTVLYGSAFLPWDHGL